MRKATLAGIAFCMALAAIPAGVWAEEKTLTGEPVDIACYLQGRAGEGHASCAKSCAERGQPIGLAVKEGDKTELYLCLGGGGKQPKDLLGEHMGKQVKVTGSVSEKEGLKVITVAKVE